ncbi:PIG-U-domain-containing protein [Hyphopichia burtonii NRRL Y-1933]|uniref:PIG-U-domain-containing protein n=1 Tax=Hyphopichia burtonii NRRL Y-1933 TaxID=984485 RepID=A0A1E4RDF5_9ASCO|nr:PIG-U-domain-containing protein [Hyphopichia burtonii NRRL Y-1933]ODV65298.1 PIG-U-domain-containing protein [Hyphopichia burtonii NRRL Y-1933]
MSKLMQVLVVGGIIRFVLPTLIPQLPFKLASTIEVSTLINSFKSLQEAFFYLQNNIDLYDGGVNHHAPFLVILLNMVDEHLPKTMSLIVFNLIYTVIDIGITMKLIQLNRWYNEYNSKRLGVKVVGFNDDLIASFYLFNPLIILTNLSHSTLIFLLFLIIESLVQLLVEENLARSIISLAVASYLSFSPIYLLIPLIALAQTQSSKNVFYRSIAIFILSIGVLLGSSILITGNTKFISQCYLSVMSFNKISPNLGLWWYLFTEMFEFFTPFYIGIFNIYSFIYIIPITLRLYQHPHEKPIGDSFLAFVLSWIWICFTKSYPTIGDLGFILSLLPIFKSTVIPHCKFMLVTGLTLLVCLLLSPIFYYCWIVLGNGNSNFFYSINLIWGVVHVLLMMDLLWARLSYDYIQVNQIPELESKKLRLTQI